MISVKTENGKTTTIVEGDSETIVCELCHVIYSITNNVCKQTGESEEEICTSLIDEIDERVYDYIQKKNRP